MSPQPTLADRFEAFLIDLDGVVYVGDALLPGAGEALEQLRRRDTRVLFLTNDPRGSRDEYAERLRRMGVVAHASDILTSGAATAEYIRRHDRLEHARAFVIGTRSLKDEISGIGLEVTEDESGATAEFVVVGGHEGFDYRELRIASQAVRAGAGFYATNRDATFPTPDGPWPATGAILAAVEAAAGRTARVIGKPEPHMFEAARSLLRDGARVAVVGDSLEADVEGGRRAGMDTILVTTSAPETTAADHVVPNLLALLRGQRHGRWP